MNGLRPFFTYYGGKWRAAPHYPAPAYRTIVEPFAGSAGYSLRHFDRDVILIEKDARIAALWRYLIRAKPAEIAALPNVPLGGSTDDIRAAEEAKTLIGFWLNKGAAQPCKRPSAWMRSGVSKGWWGPEVRERLASQVTKIAHWKVVEGDYTSASAITATWFVDPPYQQAGRLYRHGSKDIDYDALARWCRELWGQKIVCENVGATWLPFEPFRVTKSTPGPRGKGRSAEAVWLG